MEPCRMAQALKKVEPGEAGPLCQAFAWSACTCMISTSYAAQGSHSIHHPNHFEERVGGG
eukprot:1139903-Pelagomonas_calceolata.AAC.2